ncbi:NlpC/P60 family protein [Brevibacillus ruminantium]|uniref:NlpC/P60 family protein n=1 Tax=Brevibacillus ruminantium TaxID=2950604 RepID=A0ABY4WCX8_9BACL|nr:C40 family peptidase [Brevibacillus ruminantium]USG64764.1 NlpC/P60 family protein [Brevibacillus ruminantium]
MRKTVVAFMIAGLLAMGTVPAHAQEGTPLMNVVNDLYGVPYKSSGTTKKGFDCSGFTRYVFDALGIDLPHSSASQFTVGQPVNRKDLQPGDLVFFKTNGRSISHVGIYIGNDTFVHSESGRGVVNTKLSDPYYWSKRYVGAKRIAAPILQADESTTPPAKKAVQAASTPEAQPEQQEVAPAPQPQPTEAPAPTDAAAAPEQHGAQPEKAE